MRLVPLTTGYLSFAHRLFTDPLVGFRHVLGGLVPGPIGFREVVDRDRLIQFVIQFRSSDRPIGVASAFGGDPLDGRATVSIATEPRFIGTGVALEGAGLLADYLFTHLGIRKIYAEVPEFNLPQFLRASDYMDHEGTWREHVYYAGRFWDVLVLSMHVSQWQGLREQFVEDLVADEIPPTRQDRRLMQHELQRDVWQSVEARRLG